jgi:hypothetical protein
MEGFYMIFALKMLSFFLLDSMRRKTITLVVKLLLLNLVQDLLFLIKVASNSQPTVFTDRRAPSSAFVRCSPAAMCMDPTQVAFTSSASLFTSTAAMSQGHKRTTCGLTISLLLPSAQANLKVPAILSPMMLCMLLYVALNSHLRFLSVVNFLLVPIVL